VASRSWDFGDGSASTAEAPTHSYGAGGTYTVTLTVTDNDGAIASLSQDVVVEDQGGGGGSGKIKVSPPSHSFGKVRTDKQTGMTFTVTNTGDADLYIEDINIKRDDVFTLADSTADLTLPAGEKYSFEVTFRPRDIAVYSTKLKIRSSDTNESILELELSGEGTFDATLPVELSDFTVQPQDNVAQLAWTTSSEINNAGFDVQHQVWDSPDVDPGLEAPYETIGFVEGTGTTTQAQYYSFLAEGLAPGKHRFRLKQRDFDGSFSFSDALEVTVEVPEGFVLTPPYPNPFNPQTTFTLRVAESESVTVGVYDVHGRQVRMLFDGAVRAGEEKLMRFDASGLASGLYLIRAQGTSFNLSRTVTLIR
jgi:PKD repeat protein